MTLVERLNLRINASNDDVSYALLEDVVLTATEMFLSIRYPTTMYPVNEDGSPVVDKRWDGWILRCAIELYNKQGGEGQLSHSENGISRSYTSGDISRELKAEIAPVVGVANANS